MASAAAAYLRAQLTATRYLFKAAPFAVSFAAFLANGYRTGDYLAGGGHLTGVAACLPGSVSGISVSFALVVILVSWWHHHRKQPFVFHFQNAMESWLFASNVLLLVLACVYSAVTQVAEPDLTGHLGLGTREHLLEQLSDIEEQRGKLARQQGRLILDAAKARVEAAGFAEPPCMQRNGTLVAFNPSKISVAVTKAFLAVEGDKAAGSARVNDAVQRVTAQVVQAISG